MTPDELKEVEQFAAEIVEYERTHANPARDEAEDVAWARLQAQYPGEYVAYLDVWDGDKLDRQVLAHAPSYRGIRDQLTPRPDEELERITVTHVDPPNVAVCSRLQTGEIKVTTRADRI